MKVPNVEELVKVCKERKLKDKHLCMGEFSRYERGPYYGWICQKWHFHVGPNFMDEAMLEEVRRILSLMKLGLIR